MAQETVVIDELQGLDRLTEKAKAAIVSAFQLADRYGSTEATPLHLLLSLLSDNKSLPVIVLQKLGVDTEATEKELLVKLQTQNIPKRTAAAPLFSKELKNLINEAFLVAQDLTHVYVGTEHLLVALAGMGTIDFVADLNRLGIDQSKIIDTINSTGSYPSGVFKDANEIGQSPNDENSQSSLEFFSFDMNIAAAQGKYLPIKGREKEINRLIHILARKTKNNPILVGDAGVGKTAVVEGFVQKIIKQEVPASFINKKVVSLDIAGIIAGSKVRGDVEERVLSIVNDALAEGDKIIFIDEIHMIVGAGAGGGGGIDIANILKPYLTNSDLRVIGATTLDEYRKYFETDPAITRRFQPINIDEIDAESAIDVLKHLKKTFENYHRVKISDEAIVESVKLSKRYIADRYLPDKAIDLIDEAAAQIKIGKEIEIEPDLSKLGEKLMRAQKSKERAIAEQDIPVAAKFRNQEDTITDQIYELMQGSSSGNKRKLVTPQIIRAIVSSWTNIPINTEAINQNIDLLNLQDALSKAVLGQTNAIKSVVNAVKRSHLGISDEGKPLASFLFLGPTGVGKSQLAKSLAKELFGAEEMIVQIDMSEYMESHSVSKMIGSPPGYVGYQEGGQLTETIRRRPYSVVLFDEVEKAHPDVLNILLQILNDGHLSDSKGRRVSFKNAIIIMTSNIGAQEISEDAKLGFDIDIQSTAQELVDEAYDDMYERVTTELKEYVRPELLNRIDEIIVFRGLNETDCIGITQNMLDEITSRLEERKITLKIDTEVVKFLTKEGYSKEYGGRNIKRKVQEYIENNLADFLLESGLAKRTKNKKEHLSLKVSLGKDNKIVFKVND